MSRLYIPSKRSAVVVPNCSSCGKLLGINASCQTCIDSTDPEKIGRIVKQKEAATDAAPVTALFIPVGRKVLVECGVLGKVTRHLRNKKNLVTGYSVIYEEESDFDAEQLPLNHVFLFIEKGSHYAWPDGARAVDSFAYGKKGYNGRVADVMGCGIINGVALNMHNQVSHYRMKMFANDNEVFFRFTEVSDIGQRDVSAAAAARRKPRKVPASKPLSVVQHEQVSGNAASTLFDADQQTTPTDGHHDGSTVTVGAVVPTTVVDANEEHELKQNDGVGFRFDDTGARLDDDEELSTMESWPIVCFDRNVQVKVQVKDSGTSIMGTLEAVATQKQTNLVTKWYVRKDSELLMFLHDDVDVAGAQMSQKAPPPREASSSDDDGSDDEESIKEASKKCPKTFWIHKSRMACYRLIAAHDPFAAKDTGQAWMTIAEKIHEDTKNLTTTFEGR